MKKIFLIMAASLFVMSACNNDKKENKDGKKETSMTTGESKLERNKKVIMASLDAFIKNDIDACLKDAAPGFMDYGDGSGPAMGNMDSIKMFFGMMKESLPDYKAENLMYLADGDHVAVIGDWSGTFKKDLMGMKATGKAFKFKDVDLFRMSDDGKILEHRSFANLGAVLMAK